MKIFTPLMFTIFVFLSCCFNSFAAVDKSDGHYLKIGDSKIYYEEAGAGEAIVLVHDGLLNSATWDGEWDILRKKFHVIRYDRRGFGLSDTPTKPFSQSDDLYALLTYLRIQKATIVGCSSGGGISIDFALTHPEMVDRLILIGSVLHGMVVTDMFTERGNKNNKPLETGDMKAAARNWSNDPFLIMRGDTAAQTVFYNTLIKYPHDMKYTGEFEIRLAVPAVRRLSEIHVPTLILVGDHDIPDVQSFGGAIQAGIPGARREIVKNQAHLIPLEAPVYLSDRIFAFIKQHPSVVVPETILRTYTGKYKLWDEAVTVVLKEGLLWLQIPEEWDIPLFPDHGDKFKLFLWSQDGELEFVKDTTNRIVEAKILTEDGSVNKGPRL